jgi:hypothetical protein
MSQLARNCFEQFLHPLRSGIPQGEAHAELLHRMLAHHDPPLRRHCPGKADTMQTVKHYIGISIKVFGAIFAIAVLMSIAFSPFVLGWQGGWVGLSGVLLSHILARISAPKRGMLHF